MDALLIAFFTGLTTGGLSCMVVQGGLITGSLAQQIEANLTTSKGAKKGSAPATSQRLALPIVLFLAAKLVAYTLLGFVLGLIGSVFSLTPVVKGLLQLAIAIFLLGNALRMLNVHPIFRYFSFEPPSAVTRMIRRRSKQAGNYFTPLTLGAMTILIPCGITQAMMATAISTGSPVSGAALMFAFILGTSPVFFALTYLATRLGSLMEKYFYRIVALVLIILAVISIDQGLNLVGSPFTLRQIPLGIMQAIGGGGDSSTDQAAPPAGSQLSSDLTLQVKNTGYFPRQILAPANQPLKLHLVTNKTHSCAVEFTIPRYNISVLLEETGEKVIDLPAQAPGTKLHFSCSMGMYVGDIVVQ